jgi:hypothetical protein
MRRFLIPFLAAVMLSLAIPLTSGGAPGGLSAGQLNDAGWTCFNVETPIVGPLGVHCAPPGQPFPPVGQPHIQLLYFFHTTDPTSRVPDYTCTETLIRQDLYHGQPCPTMPAPDGGYTYLPDIGIPLPYYGCHRQVP